MNKGKILIFSITVIFIFCGIAFAAKEAQTNAKIGLINLQKILLESKAGKDAKAAFDKELEGKRSALQIKEKEAKETESELRASASKMKADVRKLKEEKLADEVKELRRLKQDLEDELKKKDYELTTRLLKEIFEIARKTGEEGRYNIILQGGPQVVYIDKTADITDEVMKRYDSQYKGR